MGGVQAQWPSSLHLCDQSTDPLRCGGQWSLCPPWTNKLCAAWARNQCTAVCHMARGGRQTVATVPSWNWPKVITTNHNLLSKLSPRNCKLSISEFKNNDIRQILLVQFLSGGRDRLLVLPTSLPSLKIIFVYWSCYQISFQIYLLVLKLFNEFSWVSKVDNHSIYK